jgi:hypothetical protein
MQVFCHIHVGIDGYIRFISNYMSCFITDTTHLSNLDHILHFPFIPLS